MKTSFRLPAIAKAATLGKKLLTGLLMLLLTLPYSTGVAQKKTAPKPAAPKANLNLTYKIIDGVNGTYGYDIYREGRLMVHQPSVPALPGNEGFATKEGAEKVAGLVVKKIQKGEMPPTVSVAEMKKLKAI